MPEPAGSRERVVGRHRVAVGPVAGHRPVRVADRDDPAGQRDARAARGRRGSQRRPSARGGSARSSPRPRGPGYATASPSPTRRGSGSRPCSSGSSGPGLFSTASGTWILPTSCSRAANSSSSSDAGSSSSSSPTWRARLDDVLGMTRGAPVAHVHRGRERLDVRLHGRVVMLPHAVVLERRRGEVGELAQDLEVVLVELAVVADASPRTSTPDDGSRRSRSAPRRRARHLVLDRRAADELRGSRRGRPARRCTRTWPDDAFVGADPRADQVPRRRRGPRRRSRAADRARRARTGTTSRRLRYGTYGARAARARARRSPTRRSADGARAGGPSPNRPSFSDRSRAISLMTDDSLVRGCGSSNDCRADLTTDPFPDKAVSPPVGSRRGIILVARSRSARTGRWLAQGSGQRRRESCSAATCAARVTSAASISAVGHRPLAKHLEGAARPRRRRGPRPSTACPAAHRRRAACPRPRGCAGSTSARRRASAPPDGVRARLEHGPARRRERRERARRAPARAARAAPGTGPQASG